MKKLILLCCLAVGAHYTSTAQITNLGGTFVDLRDSDGKLLIPIQEKDNIKGDPLLDDRWATGYVKFVNGKYFKSATLRFNLYTSELFFQIGAREFLFADPVKEFSVTLEEGNSIHTRVFRNGYPASVAGTSENIFYEVLTDGPRYQLLKHQYKRLQTSFGYGDASPGKIYADGSKLYLYDAQAQTMILINTREPLANAVPGLSDEIAHLYGTPNKKIRSEKDIAELIGQMNK